jgi:predicted nucleic acid-binding protein
VRVFADTSFLCSLYREDGHLAAASALLRSCGGALVSSLGVFELRQSIRLQTHRFNNDRTQGFPARVAEEMLKNLDSDLGDGVLEVAGVDWVAVHALAEQISAEHTAGGGHRTLDVLHVATALHAGATHLYTFDGNQSRLAKKTGLKTNPL